MDRSFTRLVRKLHAAELDHLREVVEQQQRLIEQLQAECTELREQAWDADRRAEMFQDMANAQEEARELGSSAVVGLTAMGRVVLLANPHAVAN